MFEIPASTSVSLLANVTSQFADPGTLALVLVAVGIPFAFYVIKKVISVIPKR